MNDCRKSVLKTINLYPVVRTGLIIPVCRLWSLFANELTLFFAFIVFISSLNLVKKEGACFQKFMKILENKRLLAAFTIELMK